MSNCHPTKGDGEPLLETLVDFLLIHSHDIQSKPISGSLLETFFMFSSFLKKSTTDEQLNLQWPEFIQLLIKLKEICGDSLYSLKTRNCEFLFPNVGFIGKTSTQTAGTFRSKCFDFIDIFSLNILQTKLKSCNENIHVFEISSNIRDQQLSCSDTNMSGSQTATSLNTLMDLLAKEPTGRIDNSNDDEVGFERLNALLGAPTGRQKLSIEKNDLCTPKTPFFEICEDMSHNIQIAKISFFEALKKKERLRFRSREDSHYEPTKFNIHIDKRHYASLPDHVKTCLNSKIHFIPIVKNYLRKPPYNSNFHINNQNIISNVIATNQSLRPSINGLYNFTNAFGPTATDVTLGDCSYLDTCYKHSTCRYLHYYKLLPMEELNAQISDCLEFNSEIANVERISDFTWGEPVGNCIRELLPPQWINCDVTKIDFSILGKFSAIIADPSWEIHMKLPYNSSNDKDVGSLNVQQLQDEGVFFLWVTGRAIELGKQYLANWGYECVNEINWIKTNQLNRTICTGRTGHWINHSKEHLLIGIKGNPKWLRRGNDVDILICSAKDTSRKPRELYGIIERLVGKNSRKLELYGRTNNLRPGWFTIGNEVKGVNIYEQEVAVKYKESFQGQN